MTVSTRALLVVPLFLVAVGVAEADPRRTVRGVIVTPDGAPFARATVVLSAGERQLTARTDATGEFRFADVPAGKYTLVASFGKSSVTVETDDDGPVRMTLEAAPESINIREKAPPATLPELDEKTYPRSFPYSDEAILRNSWAVVWVLVLIDPQGNVAEARILKSPPDFGLEEIAVKAVKRLHYTPARDKWGRHIPAEAVVVLEWPPYWGGGRSALCKGNGPLNLDDLSPTMRDCDPPKGLEHLRLAEFRARPLGGMRGLRPPPNQRPGDY